MILFSFAMVFFLLSSSSQSFPLSCLESLHGLEGVEVLVEELKAELENFNLAMVQIQSDVEAKLRIAGIKVLSKEENEKIQPLRRPYLYIRINSYKAPWKKEVMAFNIEFALKQQVMIHGKQALSEKAFYAPTWYMGVVGIVGWKNIGEIRDSVNHLADKFIRAYSSANLRQ